MHSEYNSSKLGHCLKWRLGSCVELSVTDLLIRIKRPCSNLRIKNSRSLDVAGGPEINKDIFIKCIYIKVVVGKQTYPFESV